MPRYPIHALICVVLCSNALAASPPNRDYDPSKTWIERPWEFRYFISVLPKSHIDWGVNDWKKNLAKPDPNEYQSYEGIFPFTPVADLKLTEYSEKGAPWGTLVIEFDESGKVTTPHTETKPLRGHLNRIYNIVVAEGSGPQDWTFMLGTWYTGRSGDDLPFVPAICDDSDDIDPRYSRYKKGFKPGSVRGLFGCREWGYYLQDSETPYIDITSYEIREDYTQQPDKRGKYPLKRYSYIRPTKGWGSFDVPPKPVIGKHLSTWYCLHECPAGEAPGPIADIGAWAAKNGWPTPSIPKKQPLFPDKRYKPGEFVD